jgi:hypothetical protein
LHELAQVLWQLASKRLFQKGVRPAKITGSDPFLKQPQADLTSSSQ